MIAPQDLKIGPAGLELYAGTRKRRKATVKIEESRCATKPTVPEISYFWLLPELCLVHEIV